MKINLNILASALLPGAIFIACSSPGFAGQDPPPGTARIGKNLYRDVQPLTNESYWEYLGWLMLHYGRFSPEFQAAFPDTTISGPAIRPFFADSDTVLQHKTYFVPKHEFDRPLATVTFAKLAAYARWRTNAVYALQLTRQNLLEREAAKQFSIEKYLAAAFSGGASGPRELPAVGVYFLPEEALESLEKTPNVLITPGPRLFCRYVPAKKFR